MQAKPGRGKIAIVTDSLPPGTSGSAMLAYRLLSGFDPQDYCLITNAPAGASTPGYTPSLQGRHYYLKNSRQLRGRAISKSLRDLANLLLTVFDRARQIREIIEREKCTAVVAFTGDVTHLPASYLACRRAQIPFIPYEFDHYLYREYHTPAATLVARWFEPFIMKSAAGIFVLNEALRDDLRARFKVEAEVLYNSIDLAPYEQPTVEHRGNSKDVKIVFTGSIYDAHFDAFRNLLKAIELLDQPHIRLYVYGPQSEEFLTAFGISGPLVLCGPLALKEMPKVQREADILFLPLAFDSPYPGVVRTSAPTKMGEYLAAKRPVLVHAPPDAFISSYFSEHQCGVVVDQKEPGVLAEGIHRILTDEALRNQLAANAWQRARADFDVHAWRAKFAELTGIEDVMAAREKRGEAPPRRTLAEGKKRGEKASDSSQPLVSIIMAAYNRQDLMVETLDNVAAQTYSNWECIVVDDGSTDGTVDVLKRYAMADKRIRYVRQRNQGPAGARNHGLREARGEYVQFWDSDDFLEKRKLEAHVAYLQAHPNADIVYGSARYFRTEAPDERRYSPIGPDEPWLAEFSATGYEMLKELVAANIMVVEAPMFRRQVFERVGRFDTRLPPLEDWEFLFRCAVSGQTFHFLNSEDTLTLVRWHPSSITHDTTKVRRASVMVREKIDAAVSQPELRNINRKLAADYDEMITEQETQEAANRMSEGNRSLAARSFLSIARRRSFRARIKFTFCALVTLVTPLDTFDLRMISEPASKTMVSMFRRYLHSALKSD